ncbi:MAG: hypothetical protein IKU52_03655 [Clostridia bacterium]|nr:hypothetical protein [Clostridia bacterium]
MTEIVIMSFGYKYGFTDEVNMLYDVRCFENPYYVESLKPFSGETKQVYDYVFSDEQAKLFFDEIIGGLKVLLNRFIERERDSFTVAFGCTGGRHRSVAFALRTYNHLKEAGYNVTLYHRDCEKAENK